MLNVPAFPYWQFLAGLNVQYIGTKQMHILSFTCRRYSIDSDDDDGYFAAIIDTIHLWTQINQWSPSYSRFFFSVLKSICRLSNLHIDYWLFRNTHIIAFTRNRLLDCLKIRARQYLKQKSAYKICNACTTDFLTEAAWQIPEKMYYRICNRLKISDS